MLLPSDQWVLKKSIGLTDITPICAQCSASSCSHFYKTALCCWLSFLASTVVCAEPEDEEAEQGNSGNASEADQATSREAQETDEGSLYEDGKDGIYPSGQLHNCLSKHV